MPIHFSEKFIVETKPKPKNCRGGMQATPRMVGFALFFVPFVPIMFQSV